MATSTSGINAAGIGSGIDVNSLVTQLMAIERQPITQLNAKTSSFNAKISAYGTLKGLMSTLQTAAQALSTPAKVAAYSASIANTAVASVASSSSAVSGNYSLEVTQLAEAQKIKSAGYASASSTIASGTFTLEIGSLTGGVFSADASKTLNITIDSSNNSLSGLRDAINSAGAGVSATLINDGGSTPYRLVVTSNSTGTSNAFKFSGIAGLDFDPANTAGSSLSQITGAKDAKFTLDSIDITRSSNVVTDAIDGLTLTLKTTNTGSPTTLAVSKDSSAISAKINTFVNAYNAVITQIKSQTSYDSTTKVAGTLNGDSTVQSVRSQLRSLVGGSVGSDPSFSRLSDIGIKINVDGTLTTDAAALTTAINNPAKDISSLFATVNGTDGFASQFYNRITDMLGTDGIVTARTDGLNKSVTSVATRISQLETRLSAVEARYRNQFNALDTTIASLNSTSSYLTQQLATLMTSYT